MTRQTTNDYNLMNYFISLIYYESHMAGIDFADTIIVRRTINKGTKTVEEPLKTSEWNGQGFKDQEEKRMALAGDMYIMSAKGTKRIKLSSMEKTQIPNTKGYAIVTGKGTGKIKL